MGFKEQSYEKKAETIIKNLAKRNMTGHYFPDSKSCVEAILAAMPEGSVIGWGGSESVKECGLMDAIQNGKYNLINRDLAKSPEEAREIHSKIILSDYYLMSSNAITIDGELVNIDGNGNRMSNMIYGPSHVIMVVGMNKVVSSVEDGIRRVRNIATPPNCTRLNKSTPCAATGVCGDCLSPDCICNQIVITRRSLHNDRIHVYLVGEELGY